MNDLSPRPGPMPFRLLIDEALRQARRHFRILYLPVAVPVAVSSTLVAVTQALWFSRLTASPAAFGMTPGIYLLALINLGLLMVAFMVLLTGAMDALTGQPIDMKKAWSFALRGRILGTLLLCYVGAIASLFCCCFPALFVVPLLSFVPPVMVAEDRSGFDGISRSSELNLYLPPGGGFFDRPLFKVLLFLLVGLLISYAVGLLVALPFQLPMWIDMFRKAASGEDTLQGMSRWIWLQVPAQFLNALVSTAIYLYIAFGVSLLYFDTRGRKEGSDLRSEIDSVFGGPPPELPL
ncbi:MAG TPA: hypothetical protein VHC97_27460 [Thermoanaerobaculia bacterium]|jgi:hypothetical protein|nr:hypothetical protein [Thermoanaerobaculia bacterium]